MKPLSCISISGLFVITAACAEEVQAPKPSIRDLDFLIGKWDVTFEFFDPRKPGTGARLSETGWVTCRYDLHLNGVPKFIVCEGQMDGSNGWRRTFREYTEYNSLKGSFERVAVYSNWPGMARDRVLFDPDKRLLDVRGTLDVQNHLVERYQDYYRFNEDYTAYVRTAVSNFSDMPVDEFNPVFESAGKKVGTSR